MFVSPQNSYVKGNGILEGGEWRNDFEREALVFRTHVFIRYSRGQAPFLSWEGIARWAIYKPETGFRPVV